MSRNRLSIDSHHDSWRVDRPRARSRANSPSRSFAETVAVTRNPIVAKIIALSEPRARIPISPSGTGSVLRLANSSSRPTTRDVSMPAPAEGGEDRRLGARIGAHPPLVGLLDGAGRAVPRQVDRRQVAEQERLARIQRGDARRRPDQAHGERPPGARDPDLVADGHARLGEERVGGDDRDRPRHRRRWPLRRRRPAGTACRRSRSGRSASSRRPRRGSVARPSSGRDPARCRRSDPSASRSPRR